MTEQGKIILSLLLTLLMCSTILAPLVSGVQIDKARTLSTPDGLTWSDDIRVTKDPSPDVSPQIISDSKQSTDIIWSKGADLNFTKLDYRGRPLIKEGAITSVVFPSQHSGQYTYALARGGSDDIHLIYKAPGSAYNPVLYQRFSSDWKSKFLAVEATYGLTLSMGGTLGVSSSSTPYIIYDYFPPGGDERVGLTMIDKDGNILMEAKDLSDLNWYIEGATMVIDYNDNLRLLMNVWHGGDQGMWALTIDKYGNRPATISPQHLWATGAYGYPPIPKMAACPNGNVHLLISSSESGGGDLTYMVLNSTNRPIVGAAVPIFITKNATDYGDIQCDSQNTVYIVWADSVDGNIYYERLEPGTEGKSHTPIKLTSSGKTKTPRISIDPLDGIHVVWVDVRDGNDEIYFKFAFSYGVELDMPPKDISKIMFIHPDQTNSANMSVKNLGCFNDTMGLNLSIDYNGHYGLGWDAWLEDYKLVLGPQEVYKTRINIKGPRTGKLNDYIIVNVNATSSGNPWKIDNLTFRVYLVVSCKVEIGSPDNVHVTGAGQTSEFAVYVKNSGDIVTNVTLTLDYANMEWDVKISPSFIPLMSPHSITIVTLTVKAPKNAFANEIGEVLIEASCECNPDLRDRAVMHTMVSPTFFLSMSIDNYEKHVVPGNSTEFKITVMNEGNLPGTVAIVVEIVSGTGDWYAALDRSSVGVEANSQKSIKLTVQPPDDAPANSRLTIKVGAWNDGRTMKNEVQATVIVDPMHKLNITPVAKTDTAIPGGTAHFSLTITNTGNIDEQLDLSTLGLPQGWLSRFIKKDVEGFNVRIPQKATVLVELEVDIPIDTLSKVYDFKFAMQDEQSINWTVPLSVAVGHYFYLELTAANAKAIGGPAGTAVFDIYVMNRGNAGDRINLSTDGLPIGWKTQFVVASNNYTVLDLNAGEEKRVSLVVDIPSEVTAQSVIFQALGTSSSGVQGSVNLYIDVEKVDLRAIRLLFYPASPVKGDTVAVRFQVRNEGVIECTNVKIDFYENDQLLDEQTIGILSGGTDKEVSFTWIPIKTGLVRLKLIIDPQNKVFETNENNNGLYYNFTIKSGKSTGTPGFEPVPVLLTLSLIAVVVSRRRILRGENL